MTKNNTADNPCFFQGECDKGGPDKSLEARRLHGKIVLLCADAQPDVYEESEPVNDEQARNIVPRKTATSCSGCDYADFAG